jgi:hypothetical protein
MAPDTAPREPPMTWQQAVCRRMSTWWGLKMVGTALGITGFFALYFWIMAQTESRAVVMPLTLLDHHFAVREAALPLYLSLWVLVSLPAALARTLRELRVFTVEAGVMALLGFTLFWLWPTTVPDAGVNWSHYPSLAFLKNSDAGGNACPSLHVSFAVLATARLWQQLREVGAPGVWRWAGVAWCAAIVYATLATYQHVVLDALGGFVLAGVVLAGSPLMAPRRP